MGEGIYGGDCHDLLKVPTHLASDWLSPLRFSEHLLNANVCLAMILTCAKNMAAYVSVSVEKVTVSLGL